MISFYIKHSFGHWFPKARGILAKLRIKKLQNEIQPNKLRAFKRFCINVVWNLEFRAISIRDSARKNLNSQTTQVTSCQHEVFSINFPGGTLFQIIRNDGGIHASSILESFRISAFYIFWFSNPERYFPGYWKPPPKFAWIIYIAKTFHSLGKKRSN